MSAIRIETRIDSETLFLPQLKPLVGKSVEIIVREKSAPIITPPIRNWADVMAAVEDLENYDFDAYRAIRDVETGRADKAQA